MTVLTYVSQAEMKRRTGFGKALGYSFPKEGEILVRKGLSKDIKAKVLAHEEDHILKGEEGPGFLGTLLNFIPVVGPVLGAIATGVSAYKSLKSPKQAGDTAAAGANAELEYNRESRDLARADQAPYQKAGVTALNALMSMTGLPGGTGATAQSPAQSNVGRKCTRIIHRSW